MQIQFWSVGKNHDQYVAEGIADFTKRVNNYFTSSWKIIPPVKHASSLSEAELKKKEGEQILKLLDANDYLIALDERGKSLSSEKLASFIQNRANESVKQVVFLIGGAYGLDVAVTKRASLTWSLSSLTFPHQLVRLILAEQVYRACSILRNEKYHHS